MKTLKTHLFLMALLLINVTAYSQEINSNQNIAIVDGLYKAFAAGDIPTVLGAMDAKIVWNEAESNSLADGNPYIGPDAVLQGVFARVGANQINRY